MENRRIRPIILNSNSLHDQNTLSSRRLLPTRGSGLNTILTLIGTGAQNQSHVISGSVCRTTLRTMNRTTTILAHHDANTGRTAAHITILALHHRCHLPDTAGAIVLDILPPRNPTGIIDIGIKDVTRFHTPCLLRPTEITDTSITLGNH